MKTTLPALFLIFALAACSTPQPAPLPTATPDAYQLEVINIQARATLAAVQATTSAMQANPPGNPLF